MSNTIAPLLEPIVIPRDSTLINEKILLYEQLMKDCMGSNKPNKQKFSTLAEMLYRYYSWVEIVVNNLNWYEHIDYIQELKQKCIELQLEIKKSI